MLTQKGAAEMSQTVDDLLKIGVEDNGI